MAEKGNTIIAVCDTTKEIRLQEIISYAKLADITKTKEWDAHNFLTN